jgi:hypothetical protein
MEYKFFAEKMKSNMLACIFGFSLFGIFNPFMFAFVFAFIGLLFFWKNNPLVVLTDGYITINQGPFRSAGMIILSEIESVSWTKKRQCIITHEGKESKFIVGSLSDQSFETVKTSLENTVAANG